MGVLNAPAIIIPVIPIASRVDWRIGLFVSIIRYVAFLGRGVLNSPEIITPASHIASRVVLRIGLFGDIIRYVAFFAGPFWKPKGIISDIRVALGIITGRDFVAVIIRYAAFPDGAF